MRQLFSCLFLSLLLISCNEKRIINSIVNYIDSSIITDKNNVPIDSNQYYFPISIFQDSKLLFHNDSSTVAWYSKNLRAMNEPLLFNKKENVQTFRFTWLRTFDNPVAIRIEKIQDSVILLWKLCDGAGGYDPGKMTISNVKSIDRNTWNHFIELIRKTHFWEMETVEKEPTGLDGEQWILEGKDELRYHVVDRWSPTSGPFFDCCNFLIKKIDIDSSKLSKVKFKIDSTKMTSYGLVYILADEYPKFGENESDLFKFLSDHINSFIPNSNSKINGKVMVTLVVSENGSVQDIKILRGIRNDIDSSCLRLIKSMPPWKPGKVKGKVVKTQISFPININ